MALRRKALLAVLAALAAFSLIRRAFPGGRRVTIRSTRHEDEVDSSNCALLANGTRGFLTYAPADGAGLGAQLAAAPYSLASNAADAKPRALPPLLRPVKPI